MKIPVKALFENCEMMLRDKWGYIWGTAGVMCTQAVIDKAANSTKNPNPQLTEKYGKQWLGHMVTDCSGVMEYIWKKYGLKIPHGSSGMVREGYIINCGAVPKAGYAALVDPTPDTPDNNHIGIVSEDCQYVYEAKGTRTGFVKSKLSETKFNKFGMFKDVDYEGSGETLKPPYYATVATNSGALNVRSGPSTDYPKIGKVEKGQTVIVKTHGESGWDFINADGLQGYVSTVYLKPEKEVPDDPEPKPEPSGDVITFTVPKDDVKKWLETLERISQTLAGGIENGD